MCVDVCDQGKKPSLADFSVNIFAPCRFYSRRHSCRRCFWVWVGSWQQWCGRRRSRPWQSSCCSAWSVHHLGRRFEPPTPSDSTCPSSKGQSVGGGGGGGGIFFLLVVAVCNWIAQVVFVLPGLIHLVIQQTKRSSVSWPGLIHLFIQQTNRSSVSWPLCTTCSGSPGWGSVEWVISNSILCSSQQEISFTLIFYSFFLLLLLLQQILC